MENYSVQRVPTVIVGSGVAGLSVANSLDGECLVITAGEFGYDGSTRWAQGGIAAAVGSDDSVENHFDDTVKVSSGLTDADVAKAIVSGGPGAIEDLMYLGARFDTKATGDLELGREAGHSVRRIVKANGDSIGPEVAATLSLAAKSNPNVSFRENTIVTSLVLNKDGNQVVGVVARSTPSKGTEAFEDNSNLTVILAAEVVLATGGYSYLYSSTTNPSTSIGYGTYLAGKAGAELVDLEFVQFHPTALDIGSAGSLPLLTEAIRGEGGLLTNSNGERFMEDVHTDAELAPRDVVARANYQQIQTGLEPKLDSTHMKAEEFVSKFPGVTKIAHDNGFEPSEEPLPITPAAHYCMGGVAADLNGQTSLPGLRVVGEAASTGLHGANRLASNSLLEGLVMGSIVGKDISENSRLIPDERSVMIPTSHDFDTSDTNAEAKQEAHIRSIMWDNVGLVRNESKIKQGLDKLKALTPLTQRLEAMIYVATLVTSSALSRTESRGAHYREDHLGQHENSERSVVTSQTSSESCELRATDSTEIKLK